MCTKYQVPSNGHLLWIRIFCSVHNFLNVVVEWELLLKVVLEHILETHTERHARTVDRRVDHQLVRVILLDRVASFLLLLPVFVLFVLLAL